MRSNLFICSTPLHVLIAEKIISKMNIECYYLLYLTYVDNKRNRYYFSRLSKGSKKSLYCHLRKDNWIVFFVVFIYAWFWCAFRNIEAVYLANIKSLLNRFIILPLKAAVFTFDDGSGNISKGGYF